VIEVPPRLSPESSSPDSLTSRIVKATNNQNKISAADLKSNDPKQVWLEKELEKLGYRYLRKREARSETAAGPRAKEQLKKTDLAIAVSCCLDDRWATGGAEARWGILYEKIFWSKDPWYYALCLVLFQRVSSRAKGSGEETWARFSVVRFLWERMEKDLRRYRKTLVPAIRQPDRWPGIVKAMDAAIDAVMMEAIAYYTDKGRNSKGEREDAQKFFKRGVTYEGFKSWWRGQKNKHRLALSRASSSLVRELRAVDG
jgi:hypothetical protein